MIETMPCSTFMNHMPDGSLLRFGHPCDCHVRYDLSLSKINLLIQVSDIIDRIDRTP